MTVTLPSFLYSGNADFVGELYRLYIQNPADVDASWQSFFDNLAEDARSMLDEASGPSWSKTKTVHVIQDRVFVTPPTANTQTSPQMLMDSISAVRLIEAYRCKGHLRANLDPLGLAKAPDAPELDYRNYGFTESSLGREIFLGGLLGINRAPLKDILEKLRTIYCGTIGIEVAQIESAEQRAWFLARIESAPNKKPTTDKKKQILNYLTSADSFEKFLATKFVGTKRFGLEGGEAMIPALESIIERAVPMGLREVVFGMAHRGRLNTLINVLGKSFVSLIAAFQGVDEFPSDIAASGDVKYHLGASTDRVFAGQSVHLSMNHNPSHLEWVNPVATGKVRAKQNEARRKNGANEVMGILIHGDAAFAGQGVVAETLMMSGIKGYSTGGTIHFVINNQIGFTTNPIASRSTHYCTDIAKMINAPIFHVNGDDVEAVIAVAEMAADYRQTFHQDIIIDMVCYRRNGHNEGDEPVFTQPVMYQKIKSTPTTRAIYAQKLITEGSISQAESDKMQSDFVAGLERDFQAAASYKPNQADWLAQAWQGLTASHANEPVITGLDIKTLQEIGQKISQSPENFQINPKIAKQLEARGDAIKSGDAIDWATAEALAFGGLLLDGNPVRLSGQDCGRGTFSQRHAVLRDQVSEVDAIPLNTIRAQQEKIEILNSPLSEAAVMGFEYGYSTVTPNTLVCWEAQFGDFANTAQVIIDQFIAAGEQKWLRLSGITLLLPHGYEGQGPEHSSARLERYLQLCAQDNMQVANCSTPANYFHILRRQIKQQTRKPLILMTPKSLLRHKHCISKLTDMGAGTSFMPVIGEVEQLDATSKIRRVVLCSGKVYYDLLQARTDGKIQDVALVRVEQFYPFPETLLTAFLKSYSHAEVVWVQEEPENMGAWTFLRPRLDEILWNLKHSCAAVKYIGRTASASTANGHLKQHNLEQAEIVKKALG